MDSLTLPLVFAVGLVLGLALGWLGSRPGYAARLAARESECAGLRDRVADLQDRQDEEDATALALAPLSSSLARMERQVAVLERDRVEQFGRLGERLGEVSASTRALREQTATLAGSLNASTTRGLWGETQLRRVLEHGGMLGRCDFDEQVHAVSRHDARVRPDVVVRLPGGKVLVVDAKAPMTSFLAAQGAGIDPAERTRLLAAHGASLRRHVEALAAKDYWSAFASAPQLVVCFVPSEAVLAAAMDADPDLFETAMRRGVALASPATLLAMLRTVAYTWQQESFSEHARELLTLGRELHDRLGTLGGHVGRVGASLRRSVESYNAMVGALETRVLVTSRRMHDLDLAAQPVPSPPVVDAAPRPLTAPELLEWVDDGPGRRDTELLAGQRPRVEERAEGTG